MSHITIPATGSGDATPEVGTDQVGGAHYQQIKIVDGTIGGSVGAAVDTNGNLKVALAAATALVGASVANFPATQSMQGYVGASVANLPAVQPVSGSVSIVNQPGTQPVSIASYSVTQPVSLASASAQIGISNFPATQQIQGFIGASLSNAGALSAASQVLVGGSTTVYVASQAPQTLSGLVGASVTNFPATQSVQGTVVVASAPAQTLSGLVGASVTNFPTTQPVSGAVIASVIGYVGASITNGLTLSGAVGASISNTPQISIASYSVTQPVSLASSSVQVGISNFPATQSVQGLLGASVSNLPATQPVSGSVSVVNFPATQQTSGFVGASVTNFPATQQVTGSVALASSTIQVGVSVANFPVNIGSTTSFPAAAAVGGASPYRYITGASFNGVNVKAAAGTIYTLAAMNQNTNQRYLRLYDKSTTPSVGVDIPVQTYIIPGASAGAGAVIPLPVGMLFASGIGFGVTGGSPGDTDKTTTALGDVVVNLAFM